MNTRNTRGIGIEAAMGPQAAGELAALAESLGYGSFWLNVLGANVEPFSVLQRCISMTSKIEIGIGVFPIDTFPAAAIAPKLQEMGASSPRIIIGLAGGQMKQGLLQAMGEAIGSLREALPQSRIATGGYGPKMLELGGDKADVILGNWLTPERLDGIIADVRVGSDKAGRALPEVYLYHRAAMGEDAVARLRDELTEYRKYPVHQKHQATMGNPEWIGVAATDRSGIDAQLAPYSGKCRVVLRPLARDRADLDEWRTLFRFFAQTA